MERKIAVIQSQEALTAQLKELKLTGETKGEQHKHNGTQCARAVGWEKKHCCVPCSPTCLTCKLKTGYSVCIAALRLVVCKCMYICMRTCMSV